MIKTTEWLVDEYYDLNDWQKPYDKMVQYMRKNKEVEKWHIEIEPCELNLNGERGSYVHLKMKKIMDTIFINSISYSVDKEYPDLVYSPAGKPPRNLTHYNYASPLGENPYQE